MDSGTHTGQPSSLCDHVYSADFAEACQVRFYIGSCAGLAMTGAPQIGMFAADPENALDKMCLHSNRPGRLQPRRGATQEGALPMSDQPSERPVRKYALTRIKAGVYLLPSNDGETIWRITSYTEYGDGWWQLEDGSEKQIKGTFWATARRPMPTSETSLDDDWLWDDERWEWWSFVHPSRRQAIEEILDV